MRYLFIALWMVFLSATSAVAQVSIGIGLPGVSIGINLPVYPELVRVPGYPVYYAPRMNANFFFYDGMYWVYQRDNWYASSWYNGPWDFVAPQVVPLFVLRIPVRYYRNPPEYFRGWRRDAPPRWGDHWGNDWGQHRSGWDTWDRRSAPRPAPLPVYQKKYTGDRYPQAERQQDIHSQQYRYLPRDAQVRQFDQERAAQRSPAPSRQDPQPAPQERNQRMQEKAQQDRPQDSRRVTPSGERAAPGAPRTQSPQPGGVAPQRSDSRQDYGGPGQGAAQQSGRGQGQDKKRESDEDRGQGRNK